jgi:hypothetical protein
MGAGLRLAPKKEQTGVEHNAHLLRSILSGIVAAFFVLQLSVHAQSPSPSPASVISERTITTGDPIPPSEQAGSLRAMDITAELMQKEGANTPIEAIRQVRPLPEPLRRKMTRWVAMVARPSISMRSARKMSCR